MLSSPYWISTQCKTINHQNQLTDVTFLQIIWFNKLSNCNLKLFFPGRLILSKIPMAVKEYITTPYGYIRCVIIARSPLELSEVLKSIKFIRKSIMLFRSVSSVKKHSLSNTQRRTFIIPKLEIIIALKILNRG